MVVSVSILVYALFVVALRYSGIYPATIDVMRSVERATHVLRDASLVDDEKERLTQQLAVHLLRRFVRITALGVAVIALPALTMLAADTLQIAQFHEVAAFLGRWEVIMAATGAAVVVWVIRR